MSTTHALSAAINYPRKKQNNLKIKIKRDLDNKVLLWPLEISQLDLVVLVLDKDLDKDKPANSSNSLEVDFSDDQD